jgi:hypothetical protein
LSFAGAEKLISPGRPGGLERENRIAAGWRADAGNTGRAFFSLGVLKLDLTKLPRCCPPLPDATEIQTNSRLPKPSPRSRISVFSSFFACALFFFLVSLLSAKNKISILLGGSGSRGEQAGTRHRAIQTGQDCPSAKIRLEVAMVRFKPYSGNVLLPIFTPERYFRPHCFEEQKEISHFSKKAVLGHEHSTKVDNRLLQGRARAQFPDGGEPAIRGTRALHLQDCGRCA